MNLARTKAALVGPLTIVGALVLGACEQTEGAPERHDRSGARPDLGSLRASAVDGLEAAASDPAIVAGLGLADGLETEAVTAAVERMLARVGEDAELTRVADQLFAELQASAAIRAALLDYAQTNPDLDLSALTAGFVTYVDERLTRAEVAEVLERELARRLRAVEPELAQVVVRDAGVASQLAEAVAARLEAPALVDALAQRLGRDASARQARLERRLADPARAGRLLTAWSSTLATESQILSQILAQILDLDRSAELLAAGLAHALADPSVKAHSEQLFTLALAPSFDAERFEAELAQALAEPVVAREAAAWLSALAREPEVRELLAGLVSQFTGDPDFDAHLLAALE